MLCSVGKQGAPIIQVRPYGILVLKFMDIGKGKYNQVQ